MKKLLLLFAASVSLALSSCGGSTKVATSNEANVDSLATAFEDGINGAQDSATIVDLIGKANDNLKKLEANGDTAAAKAYKWKLQELIEKNKDKFQNMDITSAISEIANVENLSKQVVDAAKADAKTANTEAEEKTKAAVKNSEEAKDLKGKTEETLKKAEETKKAVDDVKAAAQNAKEVLNNLKKN